MKKRWFLVFMLILLPFGLLTACNSKSSIKGDFKNSEYVISLTDEINFLNELEVKGVEIKDVKFVSSNEKVLAPKTEGVFEGAYSGDAYIFARINDKNIAKTKVNVKYKFSQPKNLKMIDGVFTFDPSYIIRSGKQIFAQKYLLKYKIDGGEEQSLMLEDGVRSYTFTQKGIYDISLSALGNADDKIDKSDEKTGLFTLGVMLPVKDFSYSCSENFNQIAQFSWQSDEEHVLFDVYIDGLRIETDLTKGEFTYDFNAYQANATITLKIVSKDGEGKRDNTSQEFELKVLAAPEIEYVYKDDGYISWNNDPNVTKYIISFYDENTFRKEFHEINQGERLVEYLSNLSEGIYNVNIMAVGGNKNGQNYLNSELSKDIEVGKLAVKKPEVKFEKNTAKITFQSDSYVKKYRISCEGRSMIHDVAQGVTASFDLSFLSAGEHNLQFTALPTPDPQSDTGVKVFQYRSKAVMRVINSDALDYKFYKLANFGLVSHNLRENTSILTFNSITNANYYKVYVNDQLVKTLNTSSTGRITIEFDNLKDYEPKDNNEYDIKLVAGRNESGVEIAILSEVHKTLTILSTVEKSDTQTNGYFKWEALTNPCQYKYVIYKTDSSYTKESREQVAETSTPETRTVKELEEGYYEIEIVSLSTNVDYYLSSNFHDESEIATFQFIVTQKIEAPEVTFSEEGGLHLDIKVKEFTGKVTIYVDDQPIENPPFEEVKEEVTYTFELKFEEAKLYEIKVVSSGGDLYDNTIYLDSLPTTINVTRIAQPTISVEDTFDDIKKFNSQILHIEQCEGSTNAIVTLNDTPKLSEGYTLDLFDQSVYGENFDLNIKLKAQEGEGNNYYISSVPKIYKFRRIETPNSLKYQDGKITWINNDKSTTDYYISIILVNSKATNHSKRFFLENLSTEFDFQKFVDETIASDVEFANAYLQKEKIDIELIAYKNGYEEDTYVLFSANANTFMGEGTLHIETLDPVTIKFDTESEIISWESVRDGCTYDIYVDGVIVKKGYTSLSITKYELADNYLEEKKIEIMTCHPEQLNSALSSPIYIKKLTAPSKVTIGVTLGKYNLTVPLTDTVNTQSVTINGENIEFATGDINAYKQLSNETGEQSIVFVAKNDGGNHYYLDSAPARIQLKNLSEEEFEAGVHDDNMVWSKLCENLSGNSVWPLQYKLTVVNSDRTYYLYYENINTITLEDFEKALFDNCDGAKVTGEVKITVSATINKDYDCKLAGDTILYYGSCTSEEMNVDKLEGVGSGLEVKVVYGSESNQIESKLKSSLKISFNDSWTEKYPEGINFKVSFERFMFPDGENSIVLKSSGGPNTIYSSFMKEESNFVFTLDLNYLATLGEDYTFKPGETKFTIQVCRDGSINADVEEKVIQRFDVPRGIQVNENGTLTINEMLGASFLVEVRCGDLVSENILEDTTSLDLTSEEILKNRSGKYDIRILAFDKSDGILPSAMVSKDGYKLPGISDIQIDEYGIINIQLYPDDNLKENFVFEAKGMEQILNFVPTEDPEAQGLYHFSLLDMLYLFDEQLTGEEGSRTLDLTVRVDGSIKADYKEINFNYKVDKGATLKRINSLDKDYIVYTVDNSLPTTGFVVDVTYSTFTIQEPEPPAEGEEPGEPIVEEKSVTVRKLISVEQAKGFWSTTTGDDKGVFVKEKSSNGNTYTECFAICIDDILDSLENELGGFVKIKISRAGKIGSEVYQLSPFDFDDIYHLNKVQNVSISNNFLNIAWSNEFEDGTMPSQYIIYFQTGDETIGRYYSTVSSIDLRKIDFIQAGINYQVFIKAINYDNKIIGSSLSDNASVNKYNKPIALEVKNGKLMFEQKAFESSIFMQDIKDAFNSSGSGTVYYRLLVDERQRYSGPVDFDVTNLSNQKIVLKLTKSISNETYTVSVPAYKLFPDALITRDEMEQSYIEILRTYANSISQLADAEAKTAYTMIKLLIDSSQGIADDGDLFDDYGRSVPAGEYQLTAYQGADTSNIESDVCESTLKVYISPAPTYELKEENDENGKANYYVECRPEETMFNNGDGYVSQKAPVYKMVIRRIVNENLTPENRIELKIEKDGGGWNIYQNDEVISGAIEALDNGNFRINMTQLRKGITGLIFNQVLRVDIYACANDTGYVINGKSATFSLTYLDLSSSNIQFKDGVVSVNAKLGSDFKLLVKYKHETGEETSEVLPFNSTGETDINLEKAGRYQYILLSLNGSFSKDSLIVESFTYLIAGKTAESGAREGVYKLDLPRLTTTDNKINIDYNEKDVERTTELKFCMGNDVSLDPAYAEEDAGYYYKSSFYENTSVEPYIVGGLNNLGMPEYPSELKATEFHAYLRGNDGSFSVEDCEDFAGAEYILKLYNNGNEISPILKSDEMVIRAKMLPAATGYGIDKGDISITFNDETAPKVYDKEGADKEEGSLIYEIRVSYYLSEGVEESAVKEELYYSEISPSQTDFPGLTFDTTYNYYRMRITVLGAKKATVETLGAKKSMQGNYYLIKDSVYYEDGMQALMSSTLFTGTFTKTRTPYIEVESTGSGVRKGEISFMIDRTIYFENERPNPDKSYIDEDSAQRLSIYADYTTINGDETTIKLEGEYTFTPSTIEESKIKVVFIPSEGQLNDASGKIVLRIYAYGQNAIISSPLRITDVYKLANITEKSYDVNLENGNTVIDFSKYFEQNQVRGSNSCYKIVVDIVDSEDANSSFTYTANSGNKKLIIQTKYKKLTMQVVDNQEEAETDARKLLLSDRNILDIEVTSTEGLTFSWNDVLKRFEWEWSEETLNKEYFISMRIAGRTEESFMTNLYYMPKKLGKIPAQSISLRMRNVGEQENTLYIYSDAVGYQGEDINYDLFSDGEGSETSPYEIRSIDDFKNMSIRNDKGIFFKIMENLDISVSDMLIEDEQGGRHLFDSFYASIDGGNSIITINSNTVLTTDEESFALDGYSELKFTQYSSLFKTIESGASISNMVINYTINFASLKNSDIMFAPLAYENKGLIKNVKLSSVTINIGGDGANKVFIGGIVGVNYAQIENCENRANIDYTTPQKLNVNIAFAGIALFNRLGTSVNSIENCFNRGNISITTTSTLDTILHIAGITLLNDGGKIAYSGNEGTLTFNTTGRSVLNCYGGGIVIKSANGTLEFLYNNGNITKESQTGGVENFGGIAYSISQGIINTLVNTVSGQKVVLSVTSSPDDIGTNYGANNSSTSGLNVKELTQITIPGKDGRSLQILIMDDKYVARFTY